MFANVQLLRCLDLFQVFLIMGRIVIDGKHLNAMTEQALATFMLMYPENTLKDRS